MITRPESADVVAWAGEVETGHGDTFLMVWSDIGSMSPTCFRQKGEITVKIYGK